jgi:hypothetical protein
MGGKRADFSDLEWAGLKAETRAYLIEAARRQRTVYYKDVAQQTNDRRLHHKSEAVVDLLGEISAGEHAAGGLCSAPLWFTKTPSCPFQVRVSSARHNNWVAWPKT